MNVLMLKVANSDVIKFKQLDAAGLVPQLPLSHELESVKELFAAV